MNVQNTRRFLLILAIILVGVGAAQASDDHVESLGDYSYVKSAAGEHCEGYDVMIWKYKGSLIGFLNHHRSLRRPADGRHGRDSIFGPDGQFIV